MRLDLYALNGRDVLLNPEESVTAGELELLLATGDRAGAIAKWKDWVAAGYGKPGRTRRTEAGDALGLTANHALATAQRQDEALANLRKLGDCIVHRFDTEGLSDWMAAPERFTCVHCGGTMTPSQAHAYASGWSHHGGDPEIVLPGFTR